MKIVSCVTFALSLAATVVAQGPALQTIPLPADAAFPEGIALDEVRGVVYTASAETGAILRVNLQSRAAETVVKAGVLFPAGSNQAFPAALGMELDGVGRLWLAGGRTGKAFVVDLNKGVVVKEFDTPKGGGSLINDVALVGSGANMVAYFTDTFTPTLWRVVVKGGEIGAFEPWLTFDGTPFQFDKSGPNVNGIAVTPDGQELIIVQMGKGLLFRVDVASKAVRPIDTGGADLSGADGLVLDGNTLYVVRQTAVEIARVDLSNDRARGTVSARLKDPLLAWPATAVKNGDRLIVVNTQFNTRDTKSQKLPFTLVTVPLARLAAAK